MACRQEKSAGTGEIMMEINKAGFWATFSRLPGNTYTKLNTLLVSIKRSVLVKTDLYAWFNCSDPDFIHPGNLYLAGLSQP